jgi:hypothetical protein
MGVRSMTRTETPGPPAAPAAPGPAADASRATEPVPAESTTGPDGPGDRLVARLAMGLTLLPLAVSAVALLVAVGGDYTPSSDHALIELQTRSVGRDQVLVGLYSRGLWNHPGPAQFYLLAPFYWLTGGMSVGINLGALAVNAAAVAGMALVARRLGGTRLMLVTLVCCSLLMRAVGAELLRDPWNCYLTMLPYGLLVMLAWAMWRREAWALPVGALVAVYLAHSHVGFVVLAAPLLGWGLLGLAATTILEPDPGERRPALRRGLRAAATTAGVVALGVVPLALDAVRHTPNNTIETIRYFRHTDEPTQSVATGWRVMAGQLGISPEWLTTKRAPNLIGESPFVQGAPVPWLLAAVAVAAVVLGRRRVAGGRSFVATLAVVVGLGVVAVARTVGPAFDYRLRWTLVVGMLAGVVVGWAAWTALAHRWPGAAPRALTAGALVVLVAVSGVNVVAAATAGVPQDRNSETVGVLTTQVLDQLPEDAGPVLVTDAHHSGAWQARGLVLQLERRGIDVGVEADRADEYGRHRVLDEPPGTVLVVTRDQYVADVAARPGLRLIAEWRALPEDEIEALLARRDEITADVEAGRISALEGDERRGEISVALTDGQRAVAYHVAVFVDEAAVPAAG